MRLIKFVGIFVTIAFLAGCAALLEPRTYSEQMEKSDESFLSPGKDFPITSGDTGKQYLTDDEIKSRTPAGRYEQAENREHRSLQEELAEMENNLTPEEFERYEKVKGQFVADSERIYFLRLSPSERPHYLRTLGLQSTNATPDKPSYSALSYIRSYQRTSREIYLGMDKDQVVDRWGRPDQVEIAGHPRDGNERWTFFDNGQSKRVFFEGGKVQGWGQ
ncbi:MAG: hypothetical protein A2X86_05345 [Bdellovibrionales bacterium GWA2_49_15]|nr:MAG: hypothetical protein A2X86_05345 [Bdellovibrionales bacterium GWA2_49_15]